MTRIMYPRRDFIHNEPAISQNKKLNCQNTNMVQSVADAGGGIEGCALDGGRNVRGYA